jgi:hypothetical protein
MSKFYPIIFVFFWANNPMCYAQDKVLIQHKDFFLSQDSSIRNWISYHGLSEIIKLETINVRTNDITINFLIPDLYNWKRAKDSVRVNLGIPLQQLLFFKLLFLMEIPREQLFVQLAGKDCIIRIRWRNGNIELKEEKKQGPILDKVNVPIGPINETVFHQNTESGSKYKKVIRKLEKGLREHFNQYETAFEKYKFVSYEPSEKELVIEVRNITKAILDESYFEKIVIQFTFVPNDKILEVNYIIQAKYAAGLIWAPYDSRFKDMDPQYAEALKRFNLILKSKINLLLNN